MRILITLLLNMIRSVVSKMSHNILCSCFFLLFAFLFSGSTGVLLGNSFLSQNPDIWSQWRGPQRSGIVNGKTWPNQLNNMHLKRMWRQEIGNGYSGPIVSSDRVYTVETLDKKQEIVRAFNRFTGEQIWETTWHGEMKVPFFAARNGNWVRSTPAFDGECLYVAGMRDFLVCLRASDGSIKWQVDFMKRFGTPLPDFGFVCSPLVSEEAVYVQAGGSFIKLEKEAGTTLWRTLVDEGGMYGSAFSSPVLCTLSNVPQLVVQTRSVLAGVDPDNGNVLWQQPVKAFRGMNILTPTVIGNTLFTSSFGGRSVLFDIEKNNDIFISSKVWEDKESQGYMSTPVVINGYIYLYRRDRCFCCIDPKTKSILWTSKARFGQYCSLVANGAKILALDQKGELLLLEANPKAFTLIDRLKIAEQETWGHIAVAGDQIFIRELQAIAVYRWCKPDTTVLK